MKDDDRLVEARARIIWGESEHSVVESLVEGGFGRDEAIETVKGVQIERMHEIRKLGIRKLFWGSILCAIAVGIIFPASTEIVNSNADYLPIHGDLKAVGISLPIALFGIWKLADGFIYCLAPHRVRINLSRIEDD